jgi:hypothetical protein
MTIINPEPDNTTKVEPKVAWPAVGIYLSGVVVLALVNAFTGNDNDLLLAALPDQVEPFVLPLVPVVVQMGVGFFAKHQWRSAELRTVPSSNTTRLG